jgi:hypothetical protein
MKTLSVCLALTLLVAGILPAPVAAQSKRIDGGVASRLGFLFFWETHLDPAAPPLAQSFETAVLELGNDPIQRVMLDRAQKTYFGYGVRVERPPDGSFRVTFQPLSISPELQRLLGSDLAEWKMLPPPRFPAPRTVRPGDVLELRLLTGSAWGQTLTDYVTVREPEVRREGFGALEPTPPRFAFAPGAPRDFRIEDVELRFNQPGIYAAGRDGTTFLEEVTGAVVWVYIPTRGRYLLSLTPRPGFSRAGDVRGSMLRFTVAGETISIMSRDRIAPGDAAFNLYVRREPKWVPSYPHANRDVLTIGTD